MTDQFDKLSDAEKINVLMDNIRDLNMRHQQLSRNMNKIIDEKIADALRKYKSHCATAEREARVALRQLIAVGKFDVAQFSSEVKNG